MLSWELSRLLLEHCFVRKIIYSNWKWWHGCKHFTSNVLFVDKVYLSLAHGGPSHNCNVKKLMSFWVFNLQHFAERLQIPWFKIILISSVWWVDKLLFWICLSGGFQNCPWLLNWWRIGRDENCHWFIALIEIYVNLMHFINQISK